MFAHTYYSLKYGTLSPQKLVENAAASGIKRLVLTDINNTSCAYEFIQECKKHNIHPILGIDFRIGKKRLYTGIARNSDGFRELCALLTECSLQNKELPEVPPIMENVYIIYTNPPKPIEEFKSYEYIGIGPESVNAIYSAKWGKYKTKLIAFNQVCFLDKDGYQAHKILRAIDLNTVLSKLEVEDIARTTERMYSPKEFKSFYEVYPELLDNTSKLLSSCGIEMKAENSNNRNSFFETKIEDVIYLRKKSKEGLLKRYSEDKFNEASLRLEKELKVIEKLDFTSYFLITHDIIEYAMSNNFRHVGRGSGANSIVAYCLYITDVDPLELDLYFERFINPHRASPPDFDIDFSWTDRDQVIQYIFDKYPAGHVSLLATYNTFKWRSIIREIGKVAGLPKADIDFIINEPYATERHHPLAKKIFKYGKLIEKFPNYLSIHAGGVLISEKPLNYHTALQMMPKGFPITHFDMYGAEDLKLYKYDILSQRGLGHIKDAVQLVKENKNIEVDIYHLDKIKNDPIVKKQLKSGQCIGCFYIESPAMRGLLSKLSCDDYLHLVAASSIIRPGVAQSGMMREYIYRFHHPNEVTYLHPIFKKHLGETFGVMVYQEDVIKILHHFAGLGLDESDVLRRIMSGKRKTSDTFDKLQKRYFDNCKEKGYPDDLASEVWRQIESFGGYSFCKAHSASYAVESFQSLYLKTYHPLEFMVAVINNFGGFYNAELYFHEAFMLGGKIHPPCINHSKMNTCLYGDNIYTGFQHLLGIEEKLVSEIVYEREENGFYLSLADFTGRVDVSKTQLDKLIRIGAFRFTGLNKYELMWEKNAVHNPNFKVSEGVNLFKEDYEDFTLPVLKEGIFDQAFDEFELLGFPLCSPFNLVEKLPQHVLLSKEMLGWEGKTVYMLGYYVTTKPVRTIKGEEMHFGTWVDQEGVFFDTTHFPPSIKSYPFKGRGVYYIKGKIVLDFGFPSLEVSWMEKLSYVSDERY